MSAVLHLQVVLPAGPEVVYRALTDSRALATWFAEHAQVSLPEQRYDFWGRFTPEAPDREQGRHPLLSAEPDRELRYTWRVMNHDSQVEARLAPRGAETVLIIRQGGAEPSAEGGVYAWEDFWFLALENLRRHVDGRDHAIVRCDFSASMRGDIEHSLEIEGSAAAVFEKLIKPEELNRWIASHATVEPVVGGRFDVGWGGGLTIKIVDLVPNERLAILWEEATGTIVTWTLEESGGRTRLTLVHSGFAPDADNSGIYPGWLNFMSWVKSMVEYGPAWVAPIKRMLDTSFRFYPATIGDRQHELIAEA